MTITNKKYNFISGLPRSGSTLLTSILNQNPRFYSNISDPLDSYLNAIINATNSNVGMKSIVNNDKLKSILLGTVDNYYSDIDKEVIFNTSRSWTSSTPILNDLYGDKWKMLVCVREIPWILDSFERVVRKSPYSAKPLYDYKELANVYDRTRALMGDNPNVSGRVIGPLMSLSHLISSEDKHRAMYIEYDALASHPKEVMKHIYEYLEEPYFEHDFNNVGRTWDEYDSEAKIEGLHTVKDKVEFKKRDSILPPDLWNQYATQSFWRNNNALMRDLRYVYTYSQEEQKIEETSLPSNIAYV